MQIETLKRSHLKRNIIIAVVVVAIISAVILNFTRAKYRTTQSLPLVTGTINYTLADLNIVAMYLSGSEIDTLPDGNYELTEESYCTNEENVRDESITLSYDSATKGLSVSPMTKKGTKCYLYFDEKALGGDYILASDNPPTGQTIDWTGETTYYYIGKPNNWVQFGGFWWRIIRINGDGSIRVIYHGMSGAEVGSETRIGYDVFNGSYDNKTYVGLVHDGVSQHGYGTNSVVMNKLNTWYNNNLLDYEEDYIDTGMGFCSDRDLREGDDWDNNTIYYAPFKRIDATTASLQCNAEDVLSQDNGKLSNPIGLVTSDEYLLAGNAESYLNVNIDYWTISPCSFENGLYANVFFVNNDHLSGYRVSNSNGIRPVINIRADVELAGSGTTSDPFKVVGAS